MDLSKMSIEDLIKQQENEATTAFEKWGKSEETPLNFIDRSLYGTLLLTAKIEALTEAIELLTNMIAIKKMK